MASAIDTDAGMRQTQNRNRVPDSTHDTTAQANSISVNDRLEICRQIQVIKSYLECFNDRNIAAECLETIIKIGSAGKSDYDALQQIHILETIATALDVLRNHNQGPGVLLTKSVHDYVDQLDSHDLAIGHAADMDTAFLMMRIQSAASPPQQSHQSDTFGGLIFDLSSILLSHAKYDVWVMFVLPDGVDT
jgi:hypothetical protein